MAKLDLGSRAIDIVLSGSGIEVFLVIAQDALSCTCGYMPLHIIESGSVDHVAAPSHIPRIIQTGALTM